MTRLKIDDVNPAALRPRATNARTHSKKQIRQIASSIEQFGFNNPVIVDGAGGIIAGHGRVEAAKLIGLETVPTIRIEDLSEAEIRAYVIADNRLAERAGWDKQILALELQGLGELNLDFDLTITGFDTPEIEVLLGELDGEDDDLDEEIPAVDDAPPVTRPGDIWVIGRHRLICGDGTDAAVHDRLLDGERARMVFTDAPYNVPIAGHVSGLGKVRHQEFVAASGEMSTDQFTAFLTAAFQALASHSVDGALQFICMDWRHMREVLTAGDAAYTELKNLCIWSKTNAGMGSLYRSQHELVFVFKSGTAPHVNNVELGRHGRYRTNIWTYAGATSFGRTRDRDLAMHPTVKPVRMVADAIRDCSNRGDVVLDAFAGSGTTLVATHKTGRRGYGIELDPKYCDVIVRRVATAVGEKAVHCPTGKSFAEIERERAHAPEDAAGLPGGEQKEAAE